LRYLTILFLFLFLSIQVTNTRFGAAAPEIYTLCMKCRLLGSTFAFIPGEGRKDYFRVNWHPNLIHRLHRKLYHLNCSKYMDLRQLFPAGVG